MKALRTTEYLLGDADSDAEEVVAKAKQLGPPTLVLRWKDGAETELPHSGLQMYLELARYVRPGQSAALVEMTEWVSAQGAADILGVSRPTVYRLLDDEVLPSREAPGESVKQRPRREIPIQAVLLYRLMQEERLTAGEDAANFRKAVAAAAAAVGTVPETERPSRDARRAWAEEIVDDALTRALAAEAAQ